ncbi:hypothetical protein SCB29_21435 [Paraburkholderia sp. SIMBA_055]
MNTLVKKLCLLLAAMDLGEKELEQLLRDLRSTRPEILFDEIEFIRQWQQSSETNSEDGSALKRDVMSRDSPADAIGKVEFLLRREAGLSTRDAVAELAHAIVAYHPSLKGNNLLLPLHKKGLSEWLRRITRVISERDLLHHATVIRNKYVHASPSEWLPRR